jgi:hypothetical protein
LDDHRTAQGGLKFALIFLLLPAAFCILLFTSLNTAMSWKDIRQDKNPSGHKDGESEEKSTNRHVYVEPGVQIDFVKDLKQDYKAAQGDSTAQNKKQLFWTKVSAGLLLVYVGLTLWQARSAQKSLDTIREQFQREQRPYISITKFEIMDSVSGKRTEPQEFKIGRPLEVNIAFKNIGKTVALNFVPHYHLLFGKEPNQIRIEESDKGKQGDTVDSGAERVVTAVSLANPYLRTDAHVNPADIVKWDGSEPITVFGRFSYEDTSGTRYCNPFIVQHVPPSNWGHVSKIANLSPRDLCPKDEQRQ